jgi:basic membrane protein A
MNRRVVAASALALTLAVTGCGKSDKSDSTGTGGEGGTGPIKAAWIYVGPANDGGWSQAHDDGRKAVEQTMGDQVQTTYKELVDEQNGIKTAIDNLVKDGNKIIFATSFGYGPAIKEAAAKYKDVRFEWATGDKAGDNFSIYFGAGEESLYLTGIAAGKATKSNKIGFVASFDIPEVVRHVNAFALGVQSVNPAATVKVLKTNSWTDATKARDLATTLINEGADVIASGVDGPSPGDAALAGGAKWIGYDSDQSTNYPSIWLTAAVYHWGPYYTKQVKAAKDGSWKSGEYYGNIKDGMTDIAPFGSSVDDATRKMIEEKKSAIVSGSLNIFAGPIMDQDGTERVASGSSLSFADQMSISWYVKGVDAEKPASL